MKDFSSIVMGETLAFESVAFEKEKEILLAQIANDPKMASKPEQVIAKMVEGKIKKYYKENCLVNQEFIKDGDLTIAAYTEKTAKELKRKTAMPI